MSADKSVEPSEGRAEREKTGLLFSVRQSEKKTVESIKSKVKKNKRGKKFAQPLSKREIFSRRRQGKGGRRRERFVANISAKHTGEIEGTLKTREGNEQSMSKKAEKSSRAGHKRSSLEKEEKTTTERKGERLGKQAWSGWERSHGTLGGGRKNARVLVRV